MTLVDTPVWFACPDGYLALDLAPEPQRLDELRSLLAALPRREGVRPEALLDLLVGVNELLRAQDVIFCALGVHDDEQRETPHLSVLTVSIAPTEETNPRLALAALANQAKSQSPAGTANRNGEVLELPSGGGLLLERVASVPMMQLGVLDPNDSPGVVSGTAWDATVAVPCPGGTQLVLIQLTTPAVELADDYRQMLLEVAYTLSFDNPDPTEATPQSRIRGVLG